MTVAHLKERMDARFKSVDKRFADVDKRFDAVDERFDRMERGMDAGFHSLHDKLNSILRILDEKHEHHAKVEDEHDRRLKDLEAWQRTSGDATH